MWCPSNEAESHTALRHTAAEVLIRLRFHCFGVLGMPLIESVPCESFAGTVIASAGLARPDS